MRIRVETPVEESTRVVQMRGLFDLPEKAVIVHEWNPDFRLGEAAWNLGLIVGPSGSGKSTIARNCFPGCLVSSHKWPERKSVIDGFPAKLGIKEIADLLSSVGFSSPPDWLKPYAVLSTGQKFRVDLARAIADSANSENSTIIVFDEYTSVVDRTVAKIASAALAKTIRKRKLQFIAVTCHSDVEEWLTPDWVYSTETGVFERRLLRRRPEIELKIEKCSRSAWSIFHQHHYLSDDLMPNATCFIAKWYNRPVCFSAWIPFFGSGNKKREHRTVTLPDYQGVGIGNAVSDAIASLWAALGFNPVSTTTHPAMIQSRMRSNNWKLVREPSLGSNKDCVKHASTRLTAGFKYIGPSMSRIKAQALVNS